MKKKNTLKNQSVKEICRMFDILFSSHIDNLISKCPVKFEWFFATFRNSKTLYKRYDTRVHLCRYTHSLQSFFRNGLWYRKIWEFMFLFVFNVWIHIPIAGNDVVIWVLDDSAILHVREHYQLPSNINIDTFRIRYCTMVTTN